MPSFYRSNVEAFLNQANEQILAQLAVAYAQRGYTSQYADQTLTWERDIQSLRKSLEACVNTSASAKSWGVLLEFAIPRKELRIDIVLLIGDVVVVLEAKTGDTGLQADRQIQEYALLLHYFHKKSSDHRIVPILVSPQEADIDPTVLDQRELFRSLPAYWVAPVQRSSWQCLPRLLLHLERNSATQLSPQQWDESPYHPVPSIIEAALALKTGLEIREIAHSEASEHEIETVRQEIQGFVDRARAQRRHAICFLTGVPGSGKTLVGLSLAHSDKNRADAIHFMSGNGPLVKVLQYLFKQQSMLGGAPAPQARTEASTLIENVHAFARYYADDNPKPPSNHAIIFDEAQRAWNRAQNMRKFNRDYSEPEMLLRIMERHTDWAVVVALVGGGQEINTGEAGLEEWGRALVKSNKDWIIYASPEVLNGGASTAGHRLFDAPNIQKAVKTSSLLHLRTSNRSLRADQLATWVNHVLEGNSGEAAALNIAARFPMFLSRELAQTRSMLKEHGTAVDRYGLIGSSGAARLRSEGLEPSSTFHAEYPWEYWYLANETDVRSSYQCEVFATEFEIQGLELDWIGLCWGGDFVWSKSCGWQLRNLRHGNQTIWREIRNEEKRIYRRNAYRVLLTRARKGMIVFVPKGDPDDRTNLPAEFDATADYLIRCGVTPF